MFYEKEKKEEEKKIRERGTEIYREGKGICLREGKGGRRERIIQEGKKFSKMEKIYVLGEGKEERGTGVIEGTEFRKKEKIYMF